jgi:hypothetical protein
LGFFFVVNVSQADEYFSRGTSCIIEGNWQSVAEPGRKVALPSKLRVQFSAIYKKDLSGKVGNISKKIQRVELDNGAPVGPDFLKRFDPNAVQFTTSYEGGCAGMYIDAPSMPFSLSNSDILYLIGLLGGKMDSADPYAVTWRNEEFGNKCYLSPPAKQVSPEAPVNFIFGGDLRLLFQAALPVEIKDGLSYHILVDCQ